MRHRVPKGHVRLGIRLIHSGGAGLDELIGRKKVEASKISGDVMRDSHSGYGIITAAGAVGGLVSGASRHSIAFPFSNTAWQC